jgi:hypothetical protein
MTSQLWWHVARASGIVAWSLLAAGVIWGLGISTRSRPRRVRPSWVLDMHRFLGGLATIFTLVHVGGIVADSYTHFGPSDVLVPLVSSWHPVAVAWGVVSIYLLVAVELTSLARRRLPIRVWRAVHFASFPLFATSTIHALTAGTDVGNHLFETVVIASIVVIGVLTTRRIQQAMEPEAPRAAVS